jgi:hypothetical protein
MAATGFEEERMRRVTEAGDLHSRRAVGLDVLDPVDIGTAGGASAVVDRAGERRQELGV